MKPFQLSLLIITFIIGSCKKQDSNPVPIVEGQTFSILENLAPGSLVGTVSVSNAAELNSIRFSILEGNEGDAFAISETSGEITVSDQASIDFEQRTYYFLNIQAISGDGAKGQASVRINVLDRMSPLIENSTFWLDENAAEGSQVGQITFLNPEALSNLQFSILEGNTNDAFSITSPNGLITVSNSDALDFESRESFTLKVRINANDGETRTFAIQIRLVDLLPPMLDPISFEIEEGSPIGHLVGTLAVSNAENHLSLQFEITGGNTNEAFAIDESTGEITVNNVAAIVDDGNGEFALTVRITSSNQESETYSIPIEVLPGSIEIPVPILYLPFNNDTEDYSGNGNDAIGPANIFVEGIHGSALFFNGVTDYLTLTQNIDFTNGLSFSFWLNCYGLQSSQISGVIISKYNMFNDRRSFLVDSYDPMGQNVHCIKSFYFHESIPSIVRDLNISYLDESLIQSWGNPELYSLENPMLLSLNTWVHCVVNLTPTRLEIWLDGRLTTAKTREYSSYYESEEPIFLGNGDAMSNGQNNHYYGLLDEFRIYDRGLSPAEIQALGKR